MQSTEVFTTISIAGLNKTELKIMDWAIEHSHSYGGWCLKDRRTQEPNLSVPEKYALKESRFDDPAAVIEQNIAASDGALVFAGVHPKNDGSNLTEEICDKYDLPVFFYYLDKIALLDDFDPKTGVFAIGIPPHQTFENLVRWGRQNNVLRLYIKAPRASFLENDIAYRALKDYVVSILKSTS